MTDEKIKQLAEKAVAAVYDLDEFDREKDAEAIAAVFTPAIRKDRDKLISAQRLALCADIGIEPSCSWANIVEHVHDLAEAASRKDTEIAAQVAAALRLAIDAISDTYTPFRLDEHNNRVYLTVPEVVLELVQRIEKLIPSPSALERALLQRQQETEHDIAKQIINGTVVNAEIIAALDRSKP